MRALSSATLDGRWRRELQVACGLALMWTGVAALWLEAGLLEGQLHFAGLLLRTALVLGIWRLALHCIRCRGAGREQLAQLEELPARDFAAWVAQRLQEQGYDRVVRTGGNRGVDLIAEAPGEVAVVQCRRYVAWPIGAPALRELYTAMRDLGADRAYLATTGHMTRAAERWAADKPLDVWDAGCLARLASQEPSERHAATHLTGLVTRPRRLPAKASLPDASLARQG